MPKRRIPLSTRFERLYLPEPNSGCWLWEGSVNAFGYGLIWVNERGGRAERAHRVSVMLSGRKISAADVVRHACDNPYCVNPAHLVVGTCLENVHDRVARNRSAIGERSGRARLSASDVLAIRATPKGTRGLAKTFGVSRATIAHIKANKGWRHI